MRLLSAVSELVPSSVPAPGIHSMVGLGAPPAMEDPIPCPWSRNRLPLIGEREGLRCCQLLELLSPWKQRAGPLCEHRKGSSFSEEIRGTSLSGLPASWPGWGWGALRVTGLPHDSVSVRPCHLALSHPSWSLPPRTSWFRRADAHLAGEGKGIRGKGQFSDRSESCCYPNPSRGHS